MSNVQLFDFKSHQIRVVEINGAPWFVAADVCKTLDLDNPSYVTKRLGSDEKASFKLPNQRGSAATVISESGLYKLVMRSDKREAKGFQDWVTKVVLPAIRKDGGYIMGEEKVVTGEMSEDELILKALGILQRKVERLTAENAVLREELDVVTVDEFRALKHLYLTHGQRTQLGKIASRLSRERNSKVTYQERELTLPSGEVKTVTVKVYLRPVLEDALVILGITD